MKILPLLSWSATCSPVDLYRLPPAPPGEVLQNEAGSGLGDCEKSCGGANATCSDFVGLLTCDDVIGLLGCSCGTCCGDALLSPLPPLPAPPAPTPSPDPSLDPRQGTNECSRVRRMLSVCYLTADDERLLTFGEELALTLVVISVACALLAYAYRNWLQRKWRARRRQRAVEQLEAAAREADVFVEEATEMVVHGVPVHGVPMQLPIAESVGSDLTIAAESSAAEAVAIEPAAFAEVAASVSAPVIGQLQGPPDSEGPEPVPEGDDRSASGAAATETDW